MARKRFNAGEVRFRASKQDHERIDWLLDHFPEYASISALLRVLILREYERQQPKVATH